MNPVQFSEYLKVKQIHLSSKQLEQFHQYYELLVTWNQKVNLTAITEEEDVYLKHFYDSLTPLTEYDLPQGATLCDVGAGAGFPSIPLKIVRPDLKVVIVDSLNKRIEFLKHLIKELGLEDVQAIHHRAEEYAQTKRESFDIVTARAVARLNILSELCLPLVKENGLFIALKGSSAQEEIEEAKQAIKTLGGTFKESIDFQLPEEGGSRSLIIIHKKKKTPLKYPRNYGQIKKKPL